MKYHKRDRQNTSFSTLVSWVRLGTITSMLFLVTFVMLGSSIVNTSSTSRARTTSIVIFITIQQFLSLLRLLKEVVGLRLFGTNILVQ